MYSKGWRLDPAQVCIGLVLGLVVGIATNSVSMGVGAGIALVAVMEGVHIVRKRDAPPPITLPVDELKDLATTLGYMDILTQLTSTPVAVTLLKQVRASQVFRWNYPSSSDLVVLYRKAEQLATSGVPFVLKAAQRFRTVTYTVRREKDCWSCAHGQYCPGGHALVEVTEEREESDSWDFDIVQSEELVEIVRSTSAQENQICLEQGVPAPNPGPQADA